MESGAPLFPSTVDDTARLVQVLLPVALDESYTYRVSDTMHVAAGAIVKVPLGPRQLTGVVTEEVPVWTVPAKKLRPLAHVFDIPPLAASLLAFVDWVARYTLTPRGMVLRMILRAPQALEPIAPRMGYAKGEAIPARLTPARARVLAALEARRNAPWSKTALMERAGVSSSVIDGLLKSGALREIPLPRDVETRAPNPDFARPALNADQRHAAEILAQRVGNGASVTLLEGVTGAGKTEVYLEAIAACFRQGRQALILTPEIALSRAFLDRFAARFGTPLAEWHSLVPAKTRATHWRGALEGKLAAIAGARSALFLPFKNLGLIIVDEEHDPSYKQEEWASYHARDMAVVRGRLENIPVVLVSATPSLESRYNAARGRYHHLMLPRRATGQALPELIAIDMRRAALPAGRFLAPGLVAAVEAAVGRGEQALLFLNRRGYAPLTLCRACGHRFKCPHCSAWLVDHRFQARLICHHCGHSEPHPDACPNCGAEDALIPCGPGVERVAEEIAGLLPGRRIIVLSSDMDRSGERLKAEMQAIEQGACDIIVGTQLVTKGHNFPKLTLVGVVDADLGLGQGDLRAAERTFQLLAQVTGRAARFSGRGIGILQTFAPEHPVMKALLSGDAARFYETESAERQARHMPPFGRLAALIVSGPRRETAEDHARHLARAVPRDPAVEVLGPAEAALAVLRGRYRFRLLAHSGREVDLSAFMRQWLTTSPRPPAGVEVMVDIDPQSFL